MENQKMPEYETIRAAVAGEKWAVEKVVECYKDEIDRLSTVAVRQPDGSTKQEINEDMRQSITKKLIEALPQFPLEEMSDRQKKNRARKPVYDFRALSFYGCCFRECYAVERHFRG